MNFISFHFTSSRYGNWGVCFTYGTWFALGGLASAGKTYHNCLAVRRGVEFLLNLQMDDGGWGESYVSCPDKVIFTGHPSLKFNPVYMLFSNRNMDERRNNKPWCFFVIQKYTPLEGNRSNLVHTAWALMGLFSSGQVSVLCFTIFSK